MIPMLIVYLLKKSKKGDLILQRLSVFKGLAIKLILLLALLFTTNTNANNGKDLSNSVMFSVVKKNKVIGTIQIQKQVILDSVTYQLESNINAKYVLRFNIVGREKSIYKNENLVYSSVYRKVNDKVKANHQIVFDKGNYNVITQSKSDDLNIKTIKSNLITLYFKEPKNVKQVFSDNLKKMVPVQFLGNGKYKVQFSKGKYNIFHYVNEKCVEIEAVSSLFSVTLIPEGL